MARIVKSSSSLKTRFYLVGVLSLIVWALFFLTIFQFRLYYIWIPSGLLGIYLFNSSYRYFIGYFGERRVLRQLSKLSDVYSILSDVNIKSNSGDAQIDYVVISPYGVWSIEVKGHSGWVFGDDYKHDWLQTIKSDARVFRNNFYSPVRQNIVHCDRLEEFIESKLGINLEVGSMVVFTHAERINYSGEGIVIALDELLDVFSHFESDGIVLKSSEVSRILACLSE